MIKQAQTVGVWIKASERLPDIGDVKFKFIDQIIPVYDGKFGYYGKWDIPNFSQGIYGVHYAPTPTCNNSIEWLSEQKAIILSPDEWEKVKKCIEVMQEWIKADDDFLVNKPMWGHEIAGLSAIIQSKKTAAVKALSQLTELK